MFQTSTLLLYQPETLQRKMELGIIQLSVEPQTKLY